jgi:hypothetical protein
MRRLIKWLLGSVDSMRQSLSGRFLIEIRVFLTGIKKPIQLYGLCPNIFIIVLDYFMMQF